MNWANMINHIIFSLALPIPESTKTRLYRSWRRAGTLGRTIRPKLIRFIACQAVMR